MNTNTETITPVIEPVPAALVRARYPTAAGIGGTALLIAETITYRAITQSLPYPLRWSIAPAWCWVAAAASIDREARADTDRAEIAVHGTAISAAGGNTGAVLRAWAGAGGSGLRLLVRQRLRDLDCINAERLAGDLACEAMDPVVG